MKNILLTLDAPDVKYLLADLYEKTETFRRTEATLRLPGTHADAKTRGLIESCTSADEARIVAEYYEQLITEIETQAYERSHEGNSPAEHDASHGRQSRSEPLTTENEPRQELGPISHEHGAGIG